MNYQLIDYSEDSETQIVELAGELDLACVATLRQRLSMLIGEGKTQLVFDLSQATFIDSTVLGVLVGAVKRVREEGGAVAVACADENILTVLRLTELDEMLGVVDSVEAALDELGAR